MLRRGEIERLRQQGAATLHDFWFMSLFAGEPFLEGDTIAYFDGQLLTLCGFPLRDSKPIPKDVLVDQALTWVRRRGAQAVLFQGPEPVDFRPLSELGCRRILSSPRRQRSAELVIDCAGGGSSLLRKVQSRSRALGLKGRVTRNGLHIADHLRLVERFYRNRQLDGYLVDLAFALPALLRSRRVYRVEAYKGGALVGFALIHKPFFDLAVGLVLTHDGVSPGVSDLLYSQHIELARRLGFSAINVGRSPSVGNYRFKVKWGGRPLVPPSYAVYWASSEFQFRRYATFSPRLFRM